MNCNRIFYYTIITNITNYYFISKLGIGMHQVLKFKYEYIPTYYLTTHS